MARLLIVEDNIFVLRAVAKLLTTDGHLCLTAETVAEARRHLSENPCDLIVLDVNLPDQDGFTFCRQLRSQYRMPILFLTARDEEGDKIVGLEVGGDDYLTKPYEPRELVARVRAQLRRYKEYSLADGTPNHIKLGELVIDSDSRGVFLKGDAVHLTAREFELLCFLAHHREKALSSDWIYAQVWGGDAGMRMKTLAVYMRRLRLKIEQDPEHPSMLLTVRGFGYKLTPGVFATFRQTNKEI